MECMCVLACMYASDTAHSSTVVSARRQMDVSNTVICFRRLGLRCMLVE